MKFSTGSYFKQYNNVPRTDILSTLTVTMEVGNIDYWHSTTGQVWQTNFNPIYLPNQAFWSVELTEADHKAGIYSSKIQKQQAPNVQAPNIYKKTVGDPAFTAVIPFPEQCRESQTIPYSTNLLVANDATYTSSPDLVNSQFTFNPVHVGVFGLM